MGDFVNPEISTELVGYWKEFETPYDQDNKHTKLNVC